MKPTFIQFANAFFKISHHKWGLIPYQAIRHHIELSQLFEEHQGVICKKYRQGGFSTLSTLWCLFKAILNPGYKSLIVSNYDRESICMSRILRTAYENLPEEIKLKDKRYNDHELTLENDSIILFRSHGNLIGKGTHQDVIIFDEPAFYRSDDFENHYKALFPMTCNGGKIFLISTGNGDKNYFYELYKAAVLNQESNYCVYSPSYLEYYDYSSERMHILSENLGNRGLRQEYLGDFVEPYMGM